MPLTNKGEKILSAMKEEYGAKKGKQVFYASINKGTIKGVHKSPPSGVQGFTTTTDLPHSANHGTSPVPRDRSETGASVPGGPPSDVKTYGTFHGSPYAGTPRMRESESKGPDLDPDLPADVQKFGPQLPKKG